MSTLVYTTTVKTVNSSGVESNVTTQEFKTDYVTLDTVNIIVADGSADLIIYQGNKDFDFINILSDQRLNIVLTDDGTGFLDADLYNLQMDYSGTDLVITVSNDTGYDANVQVIISGKEPVVVPAP